MKRIVLLLTLVASALLVAGCRVDENQMRACATSCGARGVLSVTFTECTCVGAPAVDGGAR